MSATTFEQSINDLATGATAIEWVIGAIGAATAYFVCASIASLWLAILVGLLLTIVTGLLATIVPFAAMVRFPQQTEAIGRTANGFVRGITGMFKKAPSSLS